MRAKDDQGSLGYLLSVINPSFITVGEWGCFVFILPYIPSFMCCDTQISAEPILRSACIDHEPLDEAILIRDILRRDRFLVVEVFSFMIY